MGRPKRAADGGLVYHVLNRANARMTIFEDDEDYAAFEQVLEEAVERTPMRLLAYCVLPNPWHLVIWPRDDGELSRFTSLADAYAHATLARSPRQYRQWLRVPGTVQVLSGAGGRAFLHGLWVRRAERVTSEPCLFFPGTSSGFSNTSASNMSSFWRKSRDQRLPEGETVPTPTNRSQVCVSPRREGRSPSRAPGGPKAS